jgi:heme A synthase
MGSRKRTARRDHSWPALLVGALVLVGLIATAGWWLVTSREARGGTPRVVVDRESIDLGSLAFNTPAHATFTLTNAGDGALVIEGVPRVHAAKGC